jgi:hypothetical protein
LGHKPQEVIQFHRKNKYFLASNKKALFMNVGGKWMLLLLISPTVVGQSGQERNLAGQIRIATNANGQR